MSDLDFRETYQAMVGAIELLMKACESAGDIRKGEVPEDVLVVLAALVRIPASLAGEAQARRLLALLFRGLGARSLDGLEVSP